MGRFENTVPSENEISAFRLFLINKVMREWGEGRFEKDKGIIGTIFCLSNPREHILPGHMEK
jgi:hypothetical protein